MHYWTLVVGILLGMFVVPMILKAVGGGGAKAGG